jgi:COP9 signalosome complex subunit 5
LENVLGWYHSHPGYGCWLSGIDVSTQRMNQQYQDPWLAIVVRCETPNGPTRFKGNILVWRVRHPPAVSLTQPSSPLQVDPVRTSSAGKVELGAFRCYPQGYTPADAAPSEYQTVPPDKIEDFGVHANESVGQNTRTRHDCGGHPYGRSQTFTAIIHLDLSPPFLRYYPLDVSYFKSSLDAHLLRLLWNKYWVNTLSSSPLVAVGDRIMGLSLP